MGGFVLMVNVGLSFEPAKRPPTGELQVDEQWKGLGSQVANKLEVRLVEVAGQRRSLAPPPPRLNDSPCEQKPQRRRLALAVQRYRNAIWSSSSSRAACRDGGKARSDRAKPRKAQ